MIEANQKAIEKYRQQARNYKQNITKMFPPTAPKPDERCKSEDTVLKSTMSHQKYSPEINVMRQSLEQS